MTAALIEKAVLDAGLQPLPEEALERFQEYLALLLKWNERLNLTSVRQPEEILTRHFIECIFAAQNSRPTYPLSSTSAPAEDSRASQSRFAVPKFS